MAMPSMAMMRRLRPGPSAGADSHAAPDSTNARNRSPQPVPFTFPAWIAPGPQQVGFSVIPPGLVIPPPTPSFPHPPRHSRTHHVIPAPTTSFPHPPRHSHTHLVIPTPTRHSRTHHVIPAKAGIYRCAIGRTARRVAIPSRHAAKGNGKP